MLELLVPQHPNIYLLEPTGYRVSPDAVWNRSVWFFGCSHVWGMGVRRDQATPAQLEQLLGVPVLNLGVPRGGAEIITINLDRLLKVYTPQRVIIAWPSLERQLTWSAEGAPVQWTSQHLEYPEDRSAKELKRYRKLALSGVLAERNLDLARLTRDRLRHSLFDFSYLEDHRLRQLGGLPCWSRDRSSADGLDWVDICSDGWHPGVATHRRIAEWLAERIQISG